MKTVYLCIIVDHTAGVVQIIAYVPSLIKAVFVKFFFIFMPKPIARVGH